MTPTRIPVRIAGTGSVPAGARTTTASLLARTADARPVAEIEERTGIVSRDLVDADTTAAELGARALAAALARASLSPEDLARVIFVNSVGGDALIPATANAVAAALGLRGSCDCFDLNNACMGFLSALDVGARTVATGDGPVGVVVAERLSRFTTPEDPRPFLVLADAAAAAVLTQATNGGGIVASWLRNDGTQAGDVACGHPGLSGKRETIRFGNSNRHITKLALDGFRMSVEGTLARVGATLADVDWVLLHQPNGSLFRLLVTELGIDPARTVPVVHDLGSIGAASIAVALDRLFRSGRVGPGETILMAGVGAGVSYGALLVRVDG